MKVKPTYEKFDHHNHDVSLHVKVDIEQKDLIDSLLLNDYGLPIKLVDEVMSNMEVSLAYGHFDFYYDDDCNHSYGPKDSTLHNLINDAIDSTSDFDLQWQAGNVRLLEEQLELSLDTVKKYIKNNKIPDRNTQQEMKIND